MQTRKALINMLLVRAYSVCTGYVINNLCSALKFQQVVKGAGSKFSIVCMLRILFSCPNPIYIQAVFMKKAELDSNKNPILPEPETYLTQILFFLSFFCCFTSQFKSYGHGGTVSSPSHTYSWASSKMQLSSTSCIHFRL